MQIIQKAVFVVTLSLATVVFSFGQKTMGDSVATLARAMANSDIYEVSYTVGYTGAISQQYQRFERLLSLATEQQLIDLAYRYDNAVIRLYAFQALRQKKQKFQRLSYNSFNMTGQ